MELFIDNISKNFKSIRAVDSLSIKFTPGIWGLLGPNGAGKTTLMRMLVGNIKPDNGRIMMDGEDISVLKRNYLKNIGYLPQQFGFDKNQTVDSCLNYIGALKGIKKDIRHERIDKLLKDFNLDGARDRKIEMLSGGIKHRVGICQALLNDPKVLIVDEPTAGLDIEERRRFREYITKISTDKIIIISTHIVSDIEYISNYIVIMDKGGLILNGESQPLIESMGGKVFETRVKQDSMEEFKKEYRIIEFRNEGIRTVAIRYIADTPIPGSKAVSPSLNDFYLSKVSEV